MFKEITLTDKFPFSKLYIDTYKDSYYKIFKKSVYDEEIIESTFIKLTKKIYVPHSFRVPNSLSVKNTFALVLNLKKYEEFNGSPEITCNISSDEYKEAF